MRLSPSIVWLASGLAFAVIAGPAAPSRAAAPPATTPRAAPRAATPSFVEGYVGEMRMEMSASGLKDAPAAPEAHALLGRIRDKAVLHTSLALAHNLSRQEVLSTDALLPAGTVILHEAGSKFYVLADPKQKTYFVQDVEGILRALEGGIGIENTEYVAKVQHTTEKKTISGLSCRKSLVSVTYVSAIPLENERVLVQQTNDVEVWHSPDLVSQALLDHFFFKFQRDKTGTVQKVVTADLGFPMELSMAVLQGSGKRAGPAGALRIAVSNIRREKKLDAESFRLPPTGYRKLERNPYFSVSTAQP